MRKTKRRAGAAALARSIAIASLAIAATAIAADLDFSDFDDSLMKSMDEAIKELDSNIGGQEKQGALANAAQLRDGLAQAEKYFSTRTDTPRAPGFARDGQQQLTLLVQSLESNDFDAASGNVRALARSCKACHQAYKPPD
jgi:cytochrome c556